MISPSVQTKRKIERGTSASSSPLRKGKGTGRPSSASSSIRTTAPSSIPKGDPNFGKQLEHLSKEERKREKAANADRVARRLAKKQVKAAMTKGKLKFEGEGSGRERVRVRKKGGTPGASSSGKTKAKKSRVRSEANVVKRNMKK